MAADGDGDERVRVAHEQDHGDEHDEGDEALHEIDYGAFEPCFVLYASR
jgi:hypothetical protein